MDIAIISALSVAAGAFITAVAGATVKIMRARRIDHKAEAARADARVSECEKRYTKLSDEIKEVRDSFQSILVTKLVESAQAMIYAAEAQREGNIVQRDQTRAIDRVCRVLEISAERTPFDGTSTKGVTG